MTRNFDAVVVGGGLAGSAAALLLARRGWSIGLAAPRPPVADGRTTALLMPAVQLLSDLGVWSRLSGKTAPLRTMRIIDGTRRLLRAPTVSFSASEIDEDAFGHNVANADILEALNAAIDDEATITRFDQIAAQVFSNADHAEVTLADGTRLEAPLIVAADGRNSIARQAAGIASRTWSYPQSALVLTFAHRLPHGETSTEFHTEEGPFTQVPLPGNRSSLVWVVRPENADRIQTLTPEELNETIERRMESILGAVTVDSTLQRFPLSGMAAEQAGKGRVVLVGEAAHLFPPIGAQGLNLGMRDVAQLQKIDIADTGAEGIGNAVSAYERARRADIAGRTRGVDLLNRSLLTGFLPVQLARAAGLSLLRGNGPLRQFALREGMLPGSALGAFANAGGFLRKKLRRQNAGRDGEDQRGYGQD